jgi:hypothetical protein
MYSGQFGKYRSEEARRCQILRISKPEWTQENVQHQGKQPSTGDMATHRNPRSIIKYLLVVVLPLVLAVLALVLSFMALDH